MSENRERIKELEELIHYHNDKYYRGIPEITDSEFDDIEFELKSLDPTNILIHKVGTYNSDYEIEHHTPMLSLEKTRDIDTLISWIKDDESITATYKSDGTSLSLIYDGGKLCQAITRGNGVKGKNVLNHINNIPNIPKNIKYSGKVEIRGEVIITDKNFKKLINECNSRHIDPPKAQRNCVSGLLNPNKVHDLDLCSFLNFKGHDVITYNDNIFTNEIDKFSFMQQNNINTLECFVFYNDEHLRNNLLEFINKYSKNKDSMGYLTDGVVFAINNIENQQNRGFTEHHPKGKMAYKLIATTKPSTLHRIITDVSRNGIITFVGEIEPIYLSGAIIRKVSLYNARYIKEHNLGLGTKIEITRSNEVIPKIVSVLSNDNSLQYNLPDHCPICGESLKWDDNYVNLVCDGEQCNGQKIQKLYHWVNSLNIKGISIKTIESLYNNRIIGDIEDLYNFKTCITLDNIIQLEGFKERSANFIIDSLKESAQHLPLENLITGLSIKQLGFKTIKSILKYIDYDLYSDKLNNLENIDGVSIITKNIFINNIANIEKVINKLKYCGVNIIIPTQTNIINGNIDHSNIKNKKIAITGTLTTPRKELEIKIENYGGKFVSSISKETDYLICNEESNSSKYIKAKNLNIPIISEEEFLALLL